MKNIFHLKINHFKNFTLSSPTIIYFIMKNKFHLKLNHSKNFTLSSLITIVLKNYHTPPKEEYTYLEGKSLQEFSNVENQVETLWCNFLVGRKLLNHRHNFAPYVIFFDLNFPRVKKKSSINLKNIFQVVLQFDIH